MVQNCSYVRKTLYKIRQQLGVREDDGQHFSQISDTDLQEHVPVIKHSVPDAGQSMIRGSLCARGIHVPVDCLQECIAVVDPVNTARAGPIHRWRYSVAAPKSLWHIDGNHKLVR